MTTAVLRPIVSDLARTHRRLTAGMTLAALAAYAAGAGATAEVWATAALVALSFFWLPGPRESRWIERGAAVTVTLLCAWMLYVALVLGGDFMPAVLAMLLFLLSAESLRALEARNDMRLYSLSFALLIAATAFYPGLGFAAAFAAYVALSTLAMMTGYLRRQAERFRVGSVRVNNGFLWTTAALSGVTLLMSAVLFAAFPRLPRQWNVHGRPGGGDTTAGFGDRVSLGEHGGRIESNPEVMFRVEFPGGPPPQVESTYWRGRSFDAFDGVEWSRTPRVPPTGLLPEWSARRWGGPFLRARVFGGPPGAGVLFGPHPVVAVRPSSAIRTVREPTGDILFLGSDVPVYTVVSAAPHPGDARLRAAVGPEDPDLWPYLRLPPLLSPRVRALADSLMTGQETRLDQVRAVEAYFHREFGYTLDLPATRADASVEAFLFRRREGHCEYFSTAMALLLRARGIPARNVTGFLGGRWNANGGYLAVTGNEAHSWVEVWFPHYGWVPFDPTPPARADAIRRRGGDGSLAWPLLFWLDGVEYRWYKWVVDYNLEKQFALFRGVGDLFSRDGSFRRDGGDRGGELPRELLPWMIVAGAVALLVWRFRRRRGERVGPEARAYLTVRRAYARAGYAGDGAGGPLQFAEALEREGAPGAEDARRVVELYVRARFAGVEIGDDGRSELVGCAKAVRNEVRRAAREKAGRRERGRPAGV